jgi:hypothetical protein
MRIVPLHGKLARGRHAFVSARHYDLVMAYRWWVWERRLPNGSLDGPYAVTTIRLPDGRRVTIKMHQLIMGCAGVDHRNGYGLDNTDYNLRKANQAQNGANRRPSAGSTSGYKGVYRDAQSGKWRASITVNYKTRKLGRFAGEEDAARAYDDAAVEAWGSFARLNFPR